MRYAVLGLTGGTFILQQQADLPGSGWLVVLLCLAVALFIMSCLPHLKRRPVFIRHALRLAGGCCFGLFWAACFAQLALEESLPESLEGEQITVAGTVEGLPSIKERSVSFRFKVEYAQHQLEKAAVPGHILLNWYPAPKWGFIPDVQPGSSWLLQVRLKRPHGLANPHGFDYEAWLLRQGIRATGYVVENEISPLYNRQVEDFVLSGSHLVNRYRSHLRERIRQALPGKAHAGIITALVIGDQSGIDRDEWDIFSRTGVSHLVAISGLHITLVAGLAALIASWLWRHSFFTRLRLPLYLPAQKIAAMAGVSTAGIYVLLAGFGIPAQRAFYMLLVVALALWRNRVSRPLHVLAAALGAVVLIDPFSVLAPGFWLSFSAIAIIFYTSSGRLRVPGENSTGFSRWRIKVANATRLQLAITLGLLPLTLLLFGRISLISPLANAIAIPVFASLLTPVALVGCFLGDSLAFPLWQGAHLILEWVIAALEWLSAFPYAVWYAPVPDPWFFSAAIIGTLWLMAPRGWPHRWAGFLCWIPVLLATASHPPEGEIRATAIDVGQGSAILIETSSYRLLFDTGPAYASGSDAGARVILPYLRARGINYLDMIVISHGDKDHAGGTASIMGSDGIPVGTLVSSLMPDDPLLALAPNRRPCLAGDHWKEDGIAFLFVWPDLSTVLEMDNDNARSCVLKVTAGSESMLLTGDIGLAEEATLLSYDVGYLESTVLMAPHHGSVNSSSLAFLNAVKPELGIFQAGYRNPYNHPDPRIVALYEVAGAKTYRSDMDGAIFIRLGNGVKVDSWRQTHRRYWHGH